MGELSWYQKVRLRTIETLAFWRGSLNSRDLTERFGISRVVALGDIHRYMEQAPGNLIYRKSDKAFFATDAFKNKITSGVIDEWITLDAFLCEYINKPQFEIKPELARPLIQATCKRTGVTVMHHSIKHPDGAERSIFPHTLVYSGLHWHIPHTRLVLCAKGLSGLQSFPCVKRNCTERSASARGWARSR